MSFRNKIQSINGTCLFVVLYYLQYKVIIKPGDTYSYDDPYRQIDLTAVNPICRTNIQNIFSMSNEIP